MLWKGMPHPTTQLATLRAIEGETQQIMDAQNTVRAFVSLPVEGTDAIRSEARSLVTRRANQRPPVLRPAVSNGLPRPGARRTDIGTRAA